MRSSALPKRYGWGVHSNEEGKLALIAVESAMYKKLSSDKDTTHLKAMRSRRAWVFVLILGRFMKLLGGNNG